MKNPANKVSLIPELKQNFLLDAVLNNDFGRNLLRDALKKYAEETKIELSLKNIASVYADDFGKDAKNHELILNMKISLNQYETIVSPIFQRAIDISLKLLERNNLKGSSIETILLVGGPTFSQTMRRMLKEQVCSNIEISIDPMTAVAKGAALFAATKDIPLNQQKRDTKKVQLTLKYPETTVETEENLGLRIDRKSSSIVLPVKLLAEIMRTDKAWSSGKIEIVDNTQIFSLHLNAGKSNGFTIILYDEKGNILPCEPSEFTIIQGLKVANATLPYNIGIDLFDPSAGKIGVYTLKGLEKNTSLPAKGKGLFKTQKDIRPGNQQDQLKIEIYECGFKEDGSKKILNELMYLSEVRIEGYKIFKEKFTAKLNKNLTVIVGENGTGKSAIKKYLEAGIPSMFGFWGFLSFDMSDTKGGIPYPDEGESAEWGHAIVAVGYDDEKKIKNTKNNKVTTGALLIRNSWGKEWGDKGYGWLPYDYVLNNLALDFWSLLGMDWVDSKQFGF